MTHATYLDTRVEQQEDCFPKVAIVAEVTLLNTRKVKSIDLEAVRMAIEKVLDDGAVEYAPQNHTIAEKH